MPGNSAVEQFLTKSQFKLPHRQSTPARHVGADPQSTSDSAPGVTLPSRSPGLPPFRLVANFVGRPECPYSSVQRHIALWIGLHTNREGRCNPGLDRLRLLSGHSRSTVAAAINRLCEPGGVFVREDQGGPRPGERYRKTGYRVRELMECD